MKRYIVRKMVANNGCEYIVHILTNEKLNKRYALWTPISSHYNKSYMYAISEDGMSRGELVYSLELNDSQYIEAFHKMQSLEQKSSNEVPDRLI